MGEAFLFGTGGGDNLKNAYAIISVEYPTGSTVTCSNTATGKTYKAGNTYGLWAFGVNSDGKWTVTATQNGQTAAVDVDISAQGQAMSFELSYKIPYIDNGKVVEGVEIIRSTATTTPMKITPYDGYTRVEFTGSGYNAFFVEGTITKPELYANLNSTSGSPTSTCLMCVWETSTTAPSRSNAIASTRWYAGENTLDISSYMGENYKIGFTTEATRALDFIEFSQR